MQPHPRCSPPVRRARLGDRQDVWPHQADQTPLDLPSVLPLPAQPLSAQGAHRDRVGHYSPAPIHEERSAGRRLGGRQQCRVRLRANQRRVVELDRVPIPGVALFHPQRDRSPLPRQEVLDAARPPQTGHVAVDVPSPASYLAARTATFPLSGPKPHRPPAPTLRRRPSEAIRPTRAPDAVQRPLANKQPLWHLRLSWRARPGL
jgi:hypothetical protein